MKSKINIMIWVLPLTGKRGGGDYYYPISHSGRKSWACLSQIKTMSTKRLLRKIELVSETEFNKILEKVSAYISGNRLSAESSEAEATNN